MKLVELSRNLYDVEVDGRKVGQVWQNSYHLTWHGAVPGGPPVGSRVGFLSKESAAEAVVEVASRMRG